MAALSIRHILFPFDFSHQGHQAARYVAAYAKRFGAKLTVLSVVPPAFEAVPAAMGGAALHVGTESVTWIRELKRRLDDVAFDDFAGLDVERRSACGDPALRIAEAAKADIDLVMMPTHGFGAFRAFLLGSVTSKVLHDVSCPVWTAAHTETQQTADVPRTVLCAVNKDTEGVAVIEYAARLANAFAANLKIAHVVEPISDWLELPRERDLQEQVRETASDAVASMLAVAGVNAESRVVVGSIADRTGEVAREEHADLVVVGRGLIAAPFGRVRTHTFSIIEQSPCPVLSV